MSRNSVFAHHLIYKITDLTNQYIYIGAHQTNDKNDTYLGSGKRLKYAIAKHGRPNFIRELLFEFNTAEEMYSKEAELVNADFINRTDTYNISLGGRGYTYLSTKGMSTLSEKTKAQWEDPGYREMMSKSSKDRWKDPKFRERMKLVDHHHTEDTKKKISDANGLRKPMDQETRDKISRAVKDGMTPERRLKISKALAGRKKPPISDETRKKMSESHKGNKNTEECRKKISMANTGKKHTEEAKKKMSDSAKLVIRKPLTAEHKERISKANKGKKKTEETIKKIAMANLGKRRSPAAKEAMSKAHKGKIPWNKGKRRA